MQRMNYLVRGTLAFGCSCLLAFGGCVRSDASDPDAGAAHDASSDAPSSDAGSPNADHHDHAGSGGEQAGEGGGDGKADSGGASGNGDAGAGGHAGAGASGNSGAGASVAGSSGAGSASLEAGSGGAGASGSTASGAGAGGAVAGASGAGAGGGAGAPAMVPHRLLASVHGVALASMPTVAKLSASVAISDDLGLDTAWSASADVDWLDVTSAGHAGSTLTLNAHADALATDVVHFAKVTIAAVGSDAMPDFIRVGFWVGSSAPQPSARVDDAFSELITDPIRPYAYVHDSKTSIVIYNVYTSEVVSTLTMVAPHLDHMAIASDGSTLFVGDATNYRIVPVDLDQLTVGTPWPLHASVSPWLVTVHSHGTELVLCGSGEIHDAKTGQLYDAAFDPGYNDSALIAASRNGRRFCTLDNGLSPYTLRCQELDYTSSDGGQVLLAPGMSTSGNAVPGVGSNGTDLALAPDGSKVYVASGAPYNFNAFDTMSLSLVQTLPGDAYPNNIEVSDDGTVLAGAAVYYGPKDAWLYQPDGYLVMDYYLSGYAKTIQPRQLKLSGDGLRIVALTDDPSLQFVGTP